MMIKSTTLFLALGSVVAAASNSADLAPSIHSNEDWDYEVVGEPRAADADEDRSLLRSATECITIRMSGDGDHDKNSASLEDLSSGKTLWEKKAGDLPEGILDSDCIAPPAGNILKFTVNTPNGYSDGFHALFVGSLRYIRVAGDDKNDVDVECFKLLKSHPFVEGAECGAAAQASAVEETPSSASNPGPPEEQEAVEIPFSSRMGCGDGKKIKVVFEKDGYNENMWYIKEKNSNKVVQECDSAGSYCKSQTVEKCLDAGDYEVVMEDKIGDGCPKFELLMENSKGNWETLSKKCYNGKNWKIHFHTKTISMTPRQQEWLEAHNERRQKYWWDGSKIKDNGNPYYVPQRWDPELARMAKIYAETLLDGCETDTMPHDPNRKGAGENMAKNRGSPGSTYGSQYPPDSILNRFVEMEMDKAFGERYHATQALWKASAYVGCADAFKEYTVDGNLKHCFTQVCRYSAPGNCGVKEHNDWEKMMYGFEDLNCGGDMKFPPNGMYST